MQLQWPLPAPARETSEEVAVLSGCMDQVQASRNLFRRRMLVRDSFSTFQFWSRADRWGCFSLRETDRWRFRPVSRRALLPYREHIPLWSGAVRPIFYFKHHECSMLHCLDEEEVHFRVGLKLERFPVQINRLPGETQMWPMCPTHSDRYRKDLFISQKSHYQPVVLFVRDVPVAFTAVPPLVAETALSPSPGLVPPTVQRALRLASSLFSEEPVQRVFEAQRTRVEAESGVLCYFVLRRGGVHEAFLRTLRGTLDARSARAQGKRQGVSVTVHRDGSLVLGARQGGLEGPLLLRGETLVVAKGTVVSFFVPLPRHCFARDASLRAWLFSLPTDVALEVDRSLQGVEEEEDSE